MALPLKTQKILKNNEYTPLCWFIWSIFGGMFAFNIKLITSKVFLSINCCNFTSSMIQNSAPVVNIEANKKYDGKTKSN